MVRRLFWRTTTTSAVVLGLAATPLATAAALETPGSLNDRAEAAAARAATAQAAPAELAATPAQANALIKYLIPLRTGNKYLGQNVGIATFDTATESMIFSRQADKPMLPASNMKIVTALTALQAIGPDKRFETTAYVPNRRTIVLHGGGDTMLTSDGLASLARQTVSYMRSNSLLPRSKRNRKPITVQVDDSLFGTPKRGPGWTGSYMPYVVRPVRPLGRLSVYTWDSAAEAGQVFTSALRGQGVKAVTGGHTTVPAGAPKAATLPSKTVAEQVRLMLQVSENNIAEMLFRQVAVATGFPATWKGSRLAATKVLTDLGLSTDRLRLKDGSGVSRTDRLTPQFLVDLLRVGLQTKKYPRFDSFLGSLPVGGRSGTLAASNGRYTTSPSKCAAGNVFAKTGTLFDTVGLSGYTKGQDGSTKIFSILVNSRPQAYSPLATRQAVDGLVATIDGCWGPSRQEGTPASTSPSPTLSSASPSASGSPSPSVSPGPTTPSPSTSASPTRTVTAIPLP